MSIPTPERTQELRKLQKTTPDQWLKRISRLESVVERVVVARIVWWDYIIFHPTFNPANDVFAATHYAYRVIERLPDKARVIRYLVRIGYPQRQAEQRVTGNHFAFECLPEDPPAAKDLFKQILNELQGNDAVKINTTMQEVRGHEEVGTDGGIERSEDRVFPDEGGGCGVGELRRREAGGVRYRQERTARTHGEVGEGSTGGRQGDGEVAQGGSESETCRVTVGAG